MKVGHEFAVFILIDILFDKGLVNHTTLQLFEK